MKDEVRYLTVSALNKYLHYKFDADQHLKRLFIQGEISNFRISGGHGYFVLKDEDAEISGIVFASVLSRLKFAPKDGTNVLIEAQVTLYQKRGTISLQVLKMEEAGLGELYRRFLVLKEKLQEEGLFDEKYKKEIPLFAEHIGVITSGTGDALHDIVSTINKRFPLAKVYLYPSLVQGQDAAQSLIRSIQTAQRNEALEVLIIARGGGSVEDLFCFNDELLARTIFHSKIPIISGVGHESDFTIADFVADFRAPTPTGAAVKATQDKQLLLENLYTVQNRLQSYIKQVLTKKYQEYQALVTNYAFANFMQSLVLRENEVHQLIKDLYTFSPIKQITRHIDTVVELRNRIVSVPIIARIDQYTLEIEKQKERIQSAHEKGLISKDQSLQTQIEKLILLNPLHIMQKGYTITKQEEHLVTSVTQLDEQKSLEVLFHDGSVQTKILKIRKDRQ